MKEGLIPFNQNPSSSTNINCVTMQSNITRKDGPNWDPMVVAAIQSQIWVGKMLRPPGELHGLERNKIKEQKIQSSYSF